MDVQSLAYMSCVHACMHVRGRESVYVCLVCVCLHVKLVWKWTCVFARKSSMVVGACV